VTATETGIPIIAHAIQLSIAPVFLLTGIAALLGVMATRLARIIDRARQIEATWRDMDDATRAAARDEMADLERRRHFASWSINFCTSAALLVCLVIVTLFVEEFFSANLKWVAGVLFVGAMLALIGGLFSFLREVYLAMHVVRIEFGRFRQRSDRDGAVR
jgi:mannose/fructose/N-acetylgalactosamine-specific phosphotransferase system component IIC